VSSAKRERKGASEARVSGRAVPFEVDEMCDECGERGAFDFMGDYLRRECADKYIEQEED
jgi:hypothetical protein